MYVQFSKLEPLLPVVHGLVRNQIPFEGLRDAHVLAARVHEWMPATHYGAQGGPGMDAAPVSPP